MFSAAPAPLPFPRRVALFDENGDGHQSGNRIEPGYVECCVESEASQGDERYVSARCGLHRICGQRRIFATPSLATLEGGQHRHCDERSNGASDSGATCLRVQAKDQRPEGN